MVELDQRFSRAPEVRHEGSTPGSVRAPQRQHSSHAKPQRSPRPVCLRRTPGQSSGGSPTGLDCTGSYAFDFNGWIASSADPALVAGQQVWAQHYSRDPGIALPNATNVTNGLRFTIGP